MFPRTAPLIHLLYLTLSAPQGVLAQDVDVQTEGLEAAIERIGYFNVVIDGCSLEFEQTYEPVLSQRGSFHQKTYLDIESLENFSSSELVTVEFQGKDIYFINLSFDVAYSGELSDLIAFRRWVSEFHPEASWPYFSPGFAPENWSEIERELSVRVRNLAELNRRVISFDGGSMTYVFDGLDSIGSENSLDLIELKNQIIAYSKAHSCDVEN